MTGKIPKKKARDGVDEYGRTPLHYAVEVSEIKSLVALGQNINLQDDNGYSPLHFSAQRKNLETILFLLKNGANPNALDIHGNSPLWTATMNAMGEFECIVALLNAGANPNQKNKHGKSPADVANVIGNGLEIIFGENKPKA